MIQDIKDLKNKKISKEAIFLGCGPSINQITVSQWKKIKEMDIWTSNNWFIHDVVPNFYHLQVKPHRNGEFAASMVKKRSEDYKNVNWILDRKKNFTLSLLLISTIKFSVHYFFFRVCTYLRFPFAFHAEKNEFLYNKLEWLRIKDLVDAPPITLGENQLQMHRPTYGSLQCQDIAEIADGLYSDRLELFIPVTIAFLIVVWFFNDKIKAR